MIRLNKGYIKAVFLFLCLWGALGMLTGRAKAEDLASGVCGSSLTWRLDSEGTLTISGRGTMTFSENLIWGGKAKSIRRLVIEDGVTSIGTNAFFCCEKMESAVIPNSVRTIGVGSFYGCEALKTVTMPGDASYPATSYYDDARCFKGCVALEELILTSNVSSTFSYYYMDNASLSSVKRVSVTGDAVRVDEGALYNLHGLKELTLSDSVTEIAQRAFSSCSNLETVRGGGTILVGDGAFSESSPYMKTPGFVILGNTLLRYNDDGKTACNVPDFVKRVCAGAFRDNPVLEAVTLPQGLEYLGDMAFSGCRALRSAAVPGGMGELKTGTFSACEALETVTLADGVKTVGSNAFSGCKSLKNAALPSSLQSLGQSAFEDCVSLEKLSLPENLTELGSSLFKNCTALREVNIGASVHTIGASAFQNCSSLVRAEIPSAVRSVGKMAFYNCTGLETLKLNAVDADYGEQVFAVDGEPEACCALVIGPEVQSLSPSLFAKASQIWTVTVSCDLDRTYDGMFSEMKGLEQAVFQGHAEALGSELFSGCSALRDVTLPQGLRTLPGKAFYHCVSLPRIVLPDGLETMEDSAFSGCSALEEAVLPQGLLKIGSDCFYSCSALRHALLPDSLTVLGQNCFYGCGQLEGTLSEGDAITYCGWAIALNNDGDKTLTIPDGTVGVIDSFHLVPDADGFEVLQLPEGLRTIGRSAFYGLTALTEDTLPSSLLWLGDGAFSQCTRLAQVNGAPASLTIGREVFAHTPFLQGKDFVLLGGTLIQYCGRDKEEVTVPDGVTSVAYQAFKNHQEIKRVLLPQSVTRLEESAFQYCGALEHIELPDGLTEIGPEAFYATGLTEINIPDGVSVLPARVFASCSSLQTAYLGEGLQEIGEEAFESCQSLQTLRLGQGLTEIGRRAFRDCRALNSISIPQSVERIGAEAFQYSGIQKIDLSSGIQLGKGVFDGSSLEQLTLDGEPVSFLWFVRTYGQTLQNTPMVKSITESWYLEDSPTAWYNANALTSKIGRIYARGLIKNGTVTNLRSAYDWMCANCGYTYSTGQHVSASDGPFFYGYASCNGVALGMKAFLDELNIPSFLMTGMVTGTYGRVSHTWNEVRSGGGFSIVDATDTKKGDYSTYMVDNYRASEGYRSNGMNVKYEFSWETLDAKEAACLNEYTPRVSSAQPLTFTRQEDGSYWVTACQNGVTDVTVPAEYQGSPVTGIGSGAFSGCPFLTRIALPEGLRTIEDEAFRGCIGLEEITLPSTVNRLGRAAFQECVSLLRADLSQSKLESLPSGSFFRCVSLWELSLPATLTDASGMRIPSRDLRNSTDGTYTLRVSGYKGTAAEEKAAELGYSFRSLGQVYRPEDAVRLLLHETLGEKDWPLLCSPETLDVNGDGAADRTDAVRLLFHGILPEQMSPAVLCIARYDDQGRMTGVLMLTGEDAARTQDLSSLKGASELRFFFLDSRFLPLTRQVTEHPGA